MVDAPQKIVQNWKPNGSIIGSQLKYVLNTQPNQKDGRVYGSWELFAETNQTNPNFFFPDFISKAAAFLSLKQMEKKSIHKIGPRG